MTNLEGKIICDDNCKIQFNIQYSRIDVENKTKNLLLPSKAS
jgi:hypothetical protein